MLDILSAI
jgi:hypothetical protein